MIINIIGMGKGKELAPTDGINWGITRIVKSRHVDVLFSMHDINILGNSSAMVMIDCEERCLRDGIKFYSCDNYPIKGVVKEFKTSFFSDSVCYAMAMAIMEDPSEINLYGINHARENKTEYERCKSGVDYWLGMANGRGIKVNIHGKKSEVGKTFDHKSYGYEIDQKEMIDRYAGSI